MARRKPPKAPASWTTAAMQAKRARKPATYSVVSKAESRNIRPIEGKLGNRSAPKKKAPGADSGKKKAPGASSVGGTGGGRQPRDARGRWR